MSVYERTITMLNFIWNGLIIFIQLIVIVVCYLEFRNFLHTDFTNETYSPVIMRRENWEIFVQWMTGANRSSQATSFRRLTDESKDENAYDGDEEDDDNHKQL